MAKLLLLPIFFFIAFSHAFSQTKAKTPQSSVKKASNATDSGKAEILVNKSILDLHEAGLGKEVIISKINNSDCKFDVSTAALISLKKAGLEADIINTMVNKSDRGNNNTTPGSVNRTGKGINVSLVNHPHYYNEVKNNVKALEKAIASTKTKMKAFGYGGTDVLYEIDGEKSAIRISGSDSVAFLLNTGGTSSPELILYKLKSENNTRNAVSMQVKTFGSMKSGDNVIACNITQLSNGLFKIIPSKKLEPGEYFFTGKPVLSSTTIDAYAFGVD